MKVLSLSEVECAPDDVVCRESPGFHLFWFLLFVGLTAGVWFWLRTVQAPVFFYVISVGGLGLFTISSGRSWTRCLRKTNWILRINGSRVLIKYRSFRNSHLDEGDPQVICLDLREIKTVRVAKESARYFVKGDKNIHAQDQSFTYLDVTVQSVDLGEVRRCLHNELNAKEKEGFIKSKTLHYPVRVVDDQTLRIEWRSCQSRVSPRAAGAAGLLTRQYVQVGEPIWFEEDFTDYQNWSREQLDQKARALIERGNSLSSAYLIEKALKMNFSQANEYVERLRRLG